MAPVRSLSRPAVDAAEAAVLSGAVEAVRARRDRLAALVHDLFQDDAVRVDDARRARMRTMLDTLVRTVEGRLRRDLAIRLEPVAPASVLMTLGNMTIAVARPWLDASRTLADPALVVALSRRVDTHRLAVEARLAARQDPDLVTHDLFGSLLAHPDRGVAAAAAAVAMATAGGHGRFDEPVLAASDLPESVLARLTWHIAAAVRRWLDTEAVSGIAADRAVAAAAGAMLTPPAATDGIDPAALLLARAMLRIGIADDDATVVLAAEGQVAVAVAGLALRAGIGIAPAWDMVLDPDGSRLVLLLRAAGLGRPAAAALLLRWPDAAAPVDRIADRMTAFDAVSPGAASDAIDVHRLDPAFVAAVDDLATGAARA